MEAKDYGAAAVHLETVRRMVEQRCPRAIFAGFSRDGARCAQYRFVLPYGRSVLVQAPVTPSGKPRRVGDHRGAWAARETDDDRWYVAETADQIVDWIGYRIDHRW